MVYVCLQYTSLIIFGFISGTNQVAVLGNGPVAKREPVKSCWLVVSRREMTRHCQTSSFVKLEDLQHKLERSKPLCLFYRQSVVIYCCRRCHLGSCAAALKGIDFQSLEANTERGLTPQPTNHEALATWQEGSSEDIQNSKWCCVCWYLTI